MGHLAARLPADDRSDDCPTGSSLLSSARPPSRPAQPPRPSARPASRPARLLGPPSLRGDYSGVVVDLAGGDPRYREDRGSADPAVTSALAAFAAGAGSEHEALSALAGSRLLVPVVAMSAHGDAQAVSSTEIALPSIVGSDGRPALPAFTCLESLRRWRQDARPVPALAASVWQSAANESSAVVIDIAGPVPLAVDGARLAALAAGAPVPRLHEDPDVQRVALEAVAEHAPGLRVALSPPVGGADLTVELAPGAGQAEPVDADAAERVAGAIADRLASRLSRGIAVLLRPPTSEAR
jgi:hypothetical protein